MHNCFNWLKFTFSVHFQSLCCMGGWAGMHMHDAKCILLLEHIMRVEQFHRRSSILVNSQSSIMFFKHMHATCIPKHSLSLLQLFTSVCTCM